MPPPPTGPWPKSQRPPIVWRPQVKQQSTFIPVRDGGHHYQPVVPQPMWHSSKKGKQGKKDPPRQGKGGWVDVAGRPFDRERIWAQASGVHAGLPEACNTARQDQAEENRHSLPNVHRESPSYSSKGTDGTMGQKGKPNLECNGRVWRKCSHSQTTEPIPLPKDQSNESGVTNSNSSSGWKQREKRHLHTLLRNMLLFQHQSSHRRTWSRR